MRTRFARAGVSVLITATAVGLAHLVAAFVAPGFSPFFTVGSFIIDLTPTPIKTYAVETFGTKDKPILLASIGAGVLLIVVALGLLLAHRPRALWLALTAVALLPLLLTFTVRGFTPIAVLPALTLLLVAQASLWFWWRALLLTPPPPLPQAQGAAMSRRGVLTAAGAFAAVAAASATVGKFVTDAKTALANIVLPKPKNPLPPKTSPFNSVSGITPYVTPAKDFYRVDINLTVPVVDHTSWQLELKRDGYDTITYSYDDILKMELVEKDITLVCVSNTVAGKYVSSGRWLGVPLKDLLAPLEPEKKGVDQIYATSVDGYTSSSNLADALDGRDALLAVGLNGEPLPREHGFPARLLIPGVYGFVGATKWLASLELTTYEAKSSYWTDRDWATDAPIKPMTRVDTPDSFAQVKAGEVLLAGVAWAGLKGVESVQVQLDGGNWQNAMVAVSKGGQNDPTKKGVLANDDDYWVQWKLPVQLEAGQHTVLARCVTKTGEVQTDVRAESFPDGASGIQSLVFTAT